jgi:hypothetical protein
MQPQVVKRQAKKYGGSLSARHGMKMGQAPELEHAKSPGKNPEAGVILMNPRCKATISEMA